MSRVMRLFVLTSLLVLAITPLPSSAQTGLATVTGLVTDNTGAAVPGVAVTATNQGTNVDYTGVSNEAGAYVITGVPIGTYVVRSELTGFKTVQSNVSLSAGQTARVDFKLEVGAVEERIEVAATGAVLQTENAVVGQTLQREQVEKLPIQGRNLATATLYAAGVTTPNPVLLQRPQEHRRRPSLRQRPARAGQQLHARRRRHERRHRQPDRLPAQPGRRRTGQRRDQQLLARARQRRRRGRQHGDQVGHQPRPAATASTTGATTTWRRRRGPSTAPAAARPSSTARSSAARSAGRSPRTRCSSSPTTRADARSRRRPTSSRPSFPTSGGAAT